MVDFEEIKKKLYRPRDVVFRPRREGESAKHYRRRQHRHVKALRNWHMVHQHNRCYFCERELMLNPPKEKWDQKITLEHLELFRDKPENSVDNTAVACMGCNNARADMPLEDFMANYEEIRAALVDKVNSRRLRKHEGKAPL